MKTVPLRAKTIGYIVVCEDGPLYWSERDRAFFLAGGTTPVTVFDTRGKADNRRAKSVAYWEKRGCGGVYWKYQIVRVATP